jgi:hypothetical protein
MAVEKGEPVAGDEQLFIVLQLAVDGLAGTLARLTAARALCPDRPALRQVLGVRREAVRQEHVRLAQLLDTLRLEADGA